MACAKRGCPGQDYCRPYLGADCDETYASLVGEDAYAATAAFVGLSGVVLCGLALNRLLAQRRLPDGGRASQRVIFLHVLAVGVLFLVTSPDPFCWSALLPCGFSDLLFDSRTCALYSLMFVVLYQWGTILDTEGCLASHQLRRLQAIAACTLIWAGVLTCSAMSEHHADWGSAKLFYLAATVLLGGLYCLQQLGEILNRLFSAGGEAVVGRLQKNAQIFAVIVLFAAAAQVLFGVLQLGEGSGSAESPPTGGGLVQPIVFVVLQFCAGLAFLHLVWKLAPSRARWPSNSRARSRSADSLQDPLLRSSFQSDRC